MNQYITFFAAHWELTLIFVVALVAIIFLEVYQRASGTPLLDPQRAVTLINRENATIVDTRDQNAFHDGHILNAIHAPLAHIGQADKLKGLQDKPILLVDANGQNSGKAAATLRKNGYNNLSILKQGMTAWTQANLPVEKK